MFVVFSSVYAFLFDSKRKKSEAGLHQFVLMIRRHGDIHVLVSFFGDDAAARGACDESELDEIGFVDFFDGAHFFSDDSGDRLDASRTASEFLDERAKNMMVGRFESEVIDFKEIECFFGGSGVDGVVSVHLSVIADAFENAIGDARRLSAGFGDDVRAFFIELNTEDARGTLHDLLDFHRFIEFQAMNGAEAIAEGVGERAELGGGADQSELRQVELKRACGGTLADHDVELVILHRRVQYFLDRFVEPMDLVDEEDIARFEVRKYRTEIADFFDGRTGSDADIHPHFFGDDIGESCFAEASRSIEKYVLYIFSATAGRFDEESEIGLDFFLADIFRESLRAERVVENDVLILFDG